jgi:dihydrofolate reductase
MIVALIVAMERSGGIGRDGGVPWRLAADLKLFKQLTMGHHLIVGRVTWESIGRPLPGREMVVVTRQPDYAAPGCEVVPSLEQGLALARGLGEREALIGGGAQIYRQALPLARRFYLTRLHADVPADTFFPPFDEGEWVVRQSREYAADAQNEYAFTFSVLEKGD